MSAAAAQTQLSPSRFREVLGQYPTGVSVVTAIEPTGKAVGLAVGSFTSVSLDPPLVAFLPDKGSSSWPKIRAAGSFCVNVLAAEQEGACRAFASRAPDKFAGLTWQPAGSGAPILDGVVAWIDCDLHDVHEAGDHYIVVGRVRALDVVRPTLPLLFFRGGYGSFTPLSSAAVEPDLLDQLRLVDVVRPAMEDIAAALGVECNAAVLVRDEFVYVARAGKPSSAATPTRVGRRLPFRPPIGATFAAWSGPEVLDGWLRRLGGWTSSEEREAWREVARRVRQRGFSLGMGHQNHAALWERLTQLSEQPPSSAPDAEIERIIDALRAGYEQRDLVPGETYEVRTVSAPVIGPDGRAVIQLTLYGLPNECNAAQIESYAARLVAGARAATEAVDGVPPD